MFVKYVTTTDCPYHSCYVRPYLTRYDTHDVTPSTPAFLDKHIRRIPNLGENSPSVVANRDASIDSASDYSFATPAESMTIPPMALGIISRLVALLQG